MTPEQFTIHIETLRAIGKTIGWVFCALCFIGIILVTK